MNEVKTLLLEARVAHTEHFIHDEQVRVGVRRHGEAQARVHSRRVALHGGVDELLQLREVDDTVEPCIDLPSAQAQDRAVEINVLSARQVRMESCPELDQGGD